MEFLSHTNEQLQQYCKGLNDKEKQDLYKQILDKAEDVIENSRDNTTELKKLSKAAVVIEEATDKQLLRKFNDDHPLREVNIVVYSPKGNSKMTNYLFSTGDSSELYDLKEDREKALYQAIKSNDIELIRQLLIILVADNPKEIDLEYLKELIILLSELYEELKPNLSKDMENYFKKKLRFYRFLCDSKVNGKTISDLIELFEIQTEVDHQIDLLLLSLIAENMQKGELLNKINNMIELLEKHERFYELEYKVRRLKSELASGKYIYPEKTIKANIEERKNEMREIKEKYIKLTDLAGERGKLLKWLQGFS